MISNDAVVAKLQQLPESDQEKLLHLIDEWMEQKIQSIQKDTRNAVSIVRNTWATITLDQNTIQWIATDKELEYDFS